MRVSSPRRTGSGWLLPVAGDGGPVTFVIDGASLLIRSVTVTGRGAPPIVEHVHTLESPPTLASPKPRC
jgi:hypothetical protein